MDSFAHILIFDRGASDDNEVIPLQTTIASRETVDAWLHRLCDILDFANAAGHGVDLMANTYDVE